jgi:hypothetical protein
MLDHGAWRVVGADDAAKRRRFGYRRRKKSALREITRDIWRKWTFWPSRAPGFNPRIPLETARVPSQGLPGHPRPCGAHS